MAIPFRGGIELTPMDWAGPPTTGAWLKGTVIVDSAGELYQCISSGTPGTWRAVGSSIPPPDMVASFPEFIDTFVNGVQAGMGWTTALNGGGAVLNQIAPPAGKGGRNQVVGVAAANTGTSTTGRAGALLGTALMRFEAGATYTLWARFLAAQLADATNSYKFRLGFLNLATASDPTNGAFFEYDRTVSPNWCCETVRSGTRSTVVTSTPVQNANWIDLKIEVDGNAQTARFYINDVLVATINTNIPNSAGQETSIGFVIHKNAGGTARYVALDRVYMKLMPS